MLLSPSNIKKYVVVRNVGINFETPNKQYSNLVFVGSDDYSEYGTVFASSLFRPIQLYCVFSPRIVRPLDRLNVHFVQNDTYATINQKTNGFLRIGRILPTAYSGRNLAYDMAPELSETIKLLRQLHKSSYMIINQTLKKYFTDVMTKRINEFNYDKNYLILPMITPIDNFQRACSSDVNGIADPFVLILARIMRNFSANADAFEGFKKLDQIFIYNPAAHAMVTFSPKDPDIDKKAFLIWNNIKRLNDFNLKADALADAVDAEKETAAATETGEVSIDDVADDTTKKITSVVLSNVAKTLKTDLTDYDAASTDEKALINKIGDKVGTYLNNDDNLTKPFDDLVKTVEQDATVKNTAINYIEAKKISQAQQAQLQKGITKENSVIDSVVDLQTDTDELIKPEAIKADVKDIPEENKQSSLFAFDREYNDRFMTKDILSVLTSFSDQPYLPITMDSYKMEDTSDSTTLKYTLTVKYRTVDGGILPFVMDIPKIVNDHFLKLKGSNYVIKKQITRLPIVKTKADTVEITTNYKKMICTRTSGKVSRGNTRLRKLLRNFSGPGVTVEYGNNSNINATGNYSDSPDFDELAEEIVRIATPVYEILTNRADTEKKASVLDLPDDFMKRDITPVGFTGADADNPHLLYILNATGELYEATPGKTPVFTKIAPNLQYFIIKTMLGLDPDASMPLGKAYRYSQAKFIAVVFPILVLTGLYDGFTTVLRKAKIEYTVSVTRLPTPTGWIEVKFKDRFFYYHDTAESSLLLNVLTSMDTSLYDFVDFDNGDGFTDYCVDYLGQRSAIYAKATVKENLSKLIDPITRTVLNDMHLPNDPVQLLLLANSMLATNSFIEPGDLRNSRLKGNEIIADDLYNILSTAYMNYQKKKRNGSQKAGLDVPQSALILSCITSLQNVSTSSALNPILENESSYSASPRGMYGINQKRAFSLGLRTFNSSMNGVLSANDTPFSGQAGISRTLTYNPSITSVRGYFGDPSVVKPNDSTNRLSVSELLSLGTSAHADPSRIAMTAGQSKQIMPVAHPTHALIGYGMEKVMPYIISNDFCFKAEKDGIVESIDRDKTKLAILKYDDGTHAAIDLKGTMLNSANNGFFINEEFAISYNAGDRFKAGDVIAYNPSFFEGSGTQCQYLNGTMAKIVVTPGDFVFEDATLITEKLGQLISTNVTMRESKVLGLNADVSSIAEVGQTVEVGTPLIQYTQSFADATTNTFLHALQKSIGKEGAAEVENQQILAKHRGIITSFDVFYNSKETGVYSPSLQAIIRKYESDNNKRKKALLDKGIPPAEINIRDSGYISDQKIDQTEFPEDGSPAVILSFYISRDDPARPGDKITYGIALKGVITKQTPDSNAPFSEYRPTEPILGSEASSGCLNRKTLELFLNIYSNKLLIELGREIHTIWNE